MPAATRNDTTLLATITQASLVSGIKAALTNAGFSSTPYGEQSGTTHRLVYEVTFNATTKGKAYIEISITDTLTVSHRIADNYNLSTFSASNASSLSSSVGFSSGASIDIISLGHPEARIILLRQGTSIKFLGYIRPANKPSWWDENLYLFAFRPSSESFNSFAGPSGTASPFGNAPQTYNFPSVANFANPNSITGLRDILSNPIIFDSASSRGIAGTFSADFCTCAATGLVRLDVLQIQPGVEEYLLLNPAAAALAIRIV